jgi:hypothetical protein
MSDKPLAIKQLEELVRIPSRVSYGQLRLHPFWDPLRGDPRFEKIVEEAKKPVALKYGSYFVGHSIPTSELSMSA